MCERMWETDEGEITAAVLLAEETYDALIALEDEVERQTRLDGLLAAARCKRGADGWPSCAEVRGRLRLAKLRWEAAQRQRGSKLTRYADAPFAALHCGQWDCTPLGVSRVDMDAAGTRSRVVACPHPIAPTERLVNVDTGSERLRVMFCKDGAWRDVVADRAELADARQIVRRLANSGVEVNSENARELVRFLADMVAVNPVGIPARRAIGRLGWIGREWKDFAPYCGGVAYDGEESTRAVFGAVREAGHFAVWRAMMRGLRGHSALFRLVMAASFASPLLEPLDALPFVLHLWGGTGAGKTVAGMCAMSVWGDPGRGRLTWSLQNTYAFFGNAAAFLRNLPFFADELQIVKDLYGDLDRLVMMLTEGVGKGRATPYGGTQEVKSWHGAFLFTGEEAVSTAASGGGVRNRLIEVQLRDGDVLVPDGNRVVGLVTQNYGHAGRKFIEYVASQDMDALRQRYRELQRELLEIRDTTDKQAYSMAAMLLADELACRSVFEGEAPLTSAEVAPYLRTRGEVDVAGRAYEWVMGWIDANPLRWVAGPGNAGELWGKVEAEVATINRYVLEQHMQRAGLPYSACVAAWGERGLLVRSNGGRTVHTGSVAGRRGQYLKLRLRGAAPQV